MAAFILSHHSTYSLLLYRPHIKTRAAVHDFLCALLAVCSNTSAELRIGKLRKTSRLSCPPGRGQSAWLPARPAGRNRVRSRAAGGPCGLQVQVRGFVIFFGVLAAWTLFRRLGALMYVTAHAALPLDLFFPLPDRTPLHHLH